MFTLNVEWSSTFSPPYFAIFNSQFSKSNIVLMIMLSIKKTDFNILPTKLILELSRFCFFSQFSFFTWNKENTISATIIVCLIIFVNLSFSFNFYLLFYKKRWFTSWTDLMIYILCIFFFIFDFVININLYCNTFNITISLIWT